VTRHSTNGKRVPTIQRVRSMRHTGRTSGNMSKGDAATPGCKVRRTFVADRGNRDERRSLM
jgi:hypothetical protein